MYTSTLFFTDNKYFKNKINVACYDFRNFTWFEHMFIVYFIYWGFETSSDNFLGSHPNTNNLQLSKNMPLITCCSSEVSEKKSPKQKNIKQTQRLTRNAKKKTG